jgi:hypothetical protein
VDRIAIQKSTGKIIEYQSGNAELGTLTQNALSSGYDEADIEEKYIEYSDYKILVDAEYEAALTYADRRKTAYDLLNQFELIGDDATNGTTTHKDAIAAIKAAHPKPE